MQLDILESIYRKALASSLERVTIDPSSGESFSFEELYYPLALDEGKYAFQSYAEQMEHAKTLNDDSTTQHSAMELKNRRASAIIERIQSIQSKKDSPAVHKQTVEETSISDDMTSGVEKKALYHQSIESIDRQHVDQVSAEGSSSFDGTQTQQINLLETEPQYDHSSLIINNGRSRILAVASAGHGKTTLLRRIALYYCRPYDGNSLTIQETYSLSGEFVPCLIQLRNITDQNYSLSKAIGNSMVSVLKNSITKDIVGAIPDSLIQKWANSLGGELLLLIDGLDELSDSMRLVFLLELEDYLLRNPQTHVIMTSRVAGLSDMRIQSVLRKMGFRGRSIIPLTDEDAKKYAERWIDVTQPSEQKKTLKDAIEQIMNQKKYMYLKEFMRTPLELLLILKQIANNSFSLNRFQMFRDTLWEYFTNHVKEFDQKRPIFDDTMTLLGFIAYQMQINDSMFISVEELEKLSEELGRLSFHTNLIKSGTLEDYKEVLDSIAANVGVVERDDRTTDIGYTFPIRAYQEFLTAHACCHLRLSEELSKPDPCSIIGQHFNDSRWGGVTNFALSDLGTNSQQEFDAILRQAFLEINDIEQLRSIVEADLTITKNHALVLCEKVFPNQRMTEEQNELLIACMNTQSAYAYVYALRSLVRSNSSNNYYLEAYALATINWEFGLGQSAYKKACSFLQSDTFLEKKLGAEMISIMARTLMDEVSAAYKDMVSKDFCLSEEILDTLATNAKLNKDVFSVIALSNIWLSQVEGSEKARLFLDEEMASLVMDELVNSNAAIRKVCLSRRNVSKSPDYLRIQELVHTLGSIPVSYGTKHLINDGQGNLFLSALLKAMYQVSKVDWNYDQVSIATACLYYCWDFNEFLDAWVYDICGGKPSEYVTKNWCGAREQNHFHLVKEGLSKQEESYREEHKKDLNVLSPPDKVFSLFRSGDILGAANYCIENMGTLNANETNLAFLIRYGHLSNDELVSQTNYSVPVLLSEGIKSGNSYALLNMGLYELEKKHYSQAISLISKITEKGWHEVSEFWHLELWTPTHDPEGALVCVFAQLFGNCFFEDYHEMVKTVKQYYMRGPQEENKYK